MVPERYGVQPWLIAGFRAGSGLNLGYPENPAKLGSSIFLCGFELGKLGFEKL